jgi:hypothetical protein
MARRAGRAAQILAGVATLLLVLPVAAAAVLVCRHILDVFGLISLPVIAAILAAALMLVVPLIAAGVQLIAPALAADGPRRRRGRAPTGYAPARERARPDLIDESALGTPHRGPAPRFTDRYGLRAPALAAIAALAIAGTLVVWWAAG